jgi:aminomethyltransferase
VEAETVGEVTSGTMSPTLNEAIGLALVAPQVEDEFEVAIRNRTVAVRTVPLPFYKREKKWREERTLRVPGELQYTKTTSG